MPPLRPGVLIVTDGPADPGKRIWHDASVLHEAGYHVTILCALWHGGEEPRACRDGIHLMRMPRAWSSAPRGLRSLMSVRRGCAEVAAVLGAAWRGQCHLVRIERQSLRQLCLAALAKLCGAGIIFDHCDLVPERVAPRPYRDGVRRHIAKLGERMAYALAGTAVVPSPALRDLVVRRAGAAPERVFTSRLWPAAIVEDCDAAARARYARGRPFLLGAVCAFDGRDGAEHLVRAMASIVTRHGRHDVQCVMTGSGPSLPEIQALALGLGIAPYVAFPGALTGAALHTLLTAADAGVVPVPGSQHSDVMLPDAVGLFLAAGRPLVQFDGCEGRRTAGQAAVSASQNDARDLAAVILQVLDDDDARQAMARAARDRYVHLKSHDDARATLLASCAGAMRPGWQPVSADARVFAER